MAMWPSAVARWVLPTPTGQDEDAGAGLGEPQGGQVGPQVPVVGEVGLVVEGVQAHRGVQAGLGSPQSGGAAFAAGYLVGEDEFEERGVAELLLPGQVEAFGQGVGHAAEFEGAQGAGQIGADRVDRCCGSGHGGHRCSCSKRVLVAGPSWRTRVNVWAGPPVR